MKKSIVTIVLLAGSSSGVEADSPSFDFVEIGFTQLSFDDSSIEPDRFELDFNKMPNDNCVAIVECLR